MKEVILFLILTTVSSLSFGQQDSDWEEFCNFPSEVKAIIFNCVVSSLDPVSQLKYEWIEQCSGTTVLIATEEACTMQDETKLKKLGECEDQIGSLEDAAFNDEEARRCIRRELDKLRRQD